MCLGRYARLKEQEGSRRACFQNKQTNKQRLTWLSHSWEEVEDKLVGPVDGGSVFYVEEFALL